MNVDYYIQEILELEAKGILNDIILTPYMFLRAMELDERKYKDAIDYIKNILQECYDSGNLKVAISHNDTNLQGYALLFVVPNYKITYLQKIFVKERYREQGLGTNILQSLVKSSDPIALLCSKEHQNFYRRNGFHYCQQFHVANGANFELSEDLYSDLSIFSNSVKNLEPPIFLLNDNDLKTIIGI